MTNEENASVSPVAPAVSTSSPRLASGATAASKESAEPQGHARCVADGRADRAGD